MVVSGSQHSHIQAAIVAIGKSAIACAVQWQREELCTHSTYLLIDADAALLESAFGTRRVQVDVELAEQGQVSAWQAARNRLGRYRLNTRIEKELVDVDLAFLVFDPVDANVLPTAALVAELLRRRSLDVELISFGVVLVSPSDDTGLAPRPDISFCRELGGYAQVRPDEATELIKLVWQPCAEHSIIGYDVADLRVLLSAGKHWFLSIVSGPMDEAGLLGRRAVEEVVKQGVRTSQISDLQFVVAGDQGMTLHMVNDVAIAIQDAVDAEANILFQSFVGDHAEGSLTVRLMVCCRAAPVARASVDLPSDDTPAAGADVAMVRWTS